MSALASTGTSGTPTTALAGLPQSSRGGSLARTQPTPRADWIANPTSRALFLILVSFGVIATRCAHTLLAQPFKHQLGIPNLRVPWFMCFITMASFPVSVGLWVVASGGRPRIDRSVLSTRLRTFAFLALLDSLNTGLSMVGLSALPAATFTIIKGASIGFVMALSKCLTPKKFNRFHYAGVSMMMLGISLMALTETRKASSQGTVVDAIISISCCLGGAFFMAALGVSQQLLLGQEKEKGGLEIVLQINAFQSTISFFLLLIPIAYSSEFQQWPQYFHQIRSSGNANLLLALAVALFILRPLNLFCNMVVTGVCSATASRALGAPRRVVIVLLGYLLFDQAVSPIGILACALVTVSFMVYVYGGIVVSRAKERKYVQDEKL